MNKYIIRRLLWAIPTLLGAVTIIFLIMRVLPGDVAMTILSEQGEAVDPVQYETLRTELGLNQPLIVQYGNWLWQFVRLDLGDSMYTGFPVWQEIGVRLPYTLMLVFLSVFISIVLAVPIGIYSALKQDTFGDYFLRSFAITGISIPGFVFGLLILLVAVSFFKWAPPLKYAPIYVDPGTALQQLFLPAIVLGYRATAVAARMMRSAMLEVMREDYVRTAWAKGLRSRTVIYLHALRNAILPVITMIGLETVLLFSTAVIVERIFNVPGIGSLLMDGITHRDFTMVQGVVGIIVAFVLVVNLLVDLVNAWVDPRIRIRA